jgi:molecular chaperone GrpE
MMMENKNMNENLEADQNPATPDHPATPDKVQENNPTEANVAEKDSCNEGKKPEETGKVENESADMKLKKENEKIKKELEEQKDKYLRLYAEYDNYRKRTQKEKSDAYTDAKIETVKAFRPLLDNMEKAQEFAKDDKNLQVILNSLRTSSKRLT